MKNRWAE